jgi:ribonucleoside-diphosphate reductase alpha chain
MLKVLTNQKESNTRALMSQTKFYEGYSRWDEDKSRYETWEESVTRVMNMHRKYYAKRMTRELSQLIDEAESLYKLQYALGAQRALQFGGDQLLKHQMRMYNCTSTYADRPRFFSELFYVLLCGAGAGFSVQYKHVNKLPDIAERRKQAKGWVIEDSIEGWADALGVLMSSFFIGGGQFPEYEGRKVYFDLSQVRPKGALINGGFKAPGPEPLRKALDKIEYLIQGRILKGQARLRPIDVYDIAMHAADAVLAGGVRRSATICLFSADDEEMINSKTGNWFEDNPQRGRSNNSAVIVRDSITREGFKNIMKSIKEFGEPGFYFVEDEDFTTNPCVEIGMYPQIDGKSGWQGCNLTEINGSKCTTKEEFFKACRAGAIMGTLQAGYTDFKYLDETTKAIFEREALLGVSVTGWMNNPEVLLDADIQREGAQIVKEVNEQVANLLGINPAARTTCVKPSGNASVLLQTSSGIHAEHSPRYIRHVQLNKDSEVAQLILESNPYMVEESVWSNNKTDYCVAFPVVSPEGSLYREDLYATKLLEKVKLVQQNWVEAGTNVERCADPRVRHNVSNTVTVMPHQWTQVEDYVYDNRAYFAGISFLAGSGDKDFAQAPNTEVLTEDQIVTRYGKAALFASGLIVDTRKAGFRDLWEATTVAHSYWKQQEMAHSGELSDLRKDWLRRFYKFAENYFDNDLTQTEYCLKDVYLLHKWTKIQQNLKPIDFISQLGEKKFTDIDTMGAIACQGGACEISF